MLVGLLSPLTRPALVRHLADGKITAVSLDLLPRTLSRHRQWTPSTSQATVTATMPHWSPPRRTALLPDADDRGRNVAPRQVLVLGAGVAGLQSIATARRSAPWSPGTTSGKRPGRDRLDRAPC